MICWTIGAASFSVWPALIGAIVASFAAWRLLAL